MKLRMMIFVLLMFPIFSQASTPSQMIRLPLNEISKSYLKKHDLDVAGINFSKNEIDALVTDEELAQIEKAGLKILFAFPQTLMAGPDQEYKTPEEIEDFLQQIHANYPDITEIKSIGKSLEGRDIWAIKISDNAKSNEVEPTVLVNGMHHAREVMTPEITTDMVEYLTKNYATDAQVKKWVDGTEIWVIPMLNVDGNNRMWSGDPMWRKNNRDNYGVDLNRNYPAGWNSCGGSSGFTWAQDYRGPSPASEPETQAMIKFVGEIKPVMNISYHSFSELVIYPFGCKPKKTPAHEAVETIGAEIAQKIKYKPGTAWELLYNADGGDIDWMYSEHQVIPFVIEVSSNSEGFQPSYKKWRNKTVERNRPGWMHLLQRLDGPSLHGKVNLSDYQTIEISSGGTKQIYKINPNGTFYVMLKPGTYDVLFKGSKTKRFPGFDVTSKKIIPSNF